ncbi:MAG TPA: cytochrome C biogenesis protein [Desulfobulbaceae bacterium]|nr:cytochrome C biogenesis protein [Desulfobulbaceae bacterium]
MMEIQSWTAELLGRLAAFLPFGYAFGAGMVSAVNPCGFFMLPVYLSFYLGTAGREIMPVSPWRRCLGALWVGGVVTLGFAVVFLVCGLVVASGGLALMSLIPWFALIIAACLIATGIWMLFDRHLTSFTFGNIAARIGDPRDITVKGFFLFGLAYALTSLGCALPIFLAMLGGAIAAGGPLLVARQCLVYIAGVGCVLVLLTMAIAFVRQGIIIGALRKILPHSQKLTAFFLLAAGVYIIYYWLSGTMPAVAS